MSKGGLALITAKILLVRKGGTLTPQAVLRRRMSRLAGEYKTDEHEAKSFKHVIQHKDREYEEHEEGGWMPHPRTGIYYPKGHEWVMDDVPHDAASFAYTFWLRNSDNDGV